MSNLCNGGWKTRNDISEYMYSYQQKKNTDLEASVFPNGFLTCLPFKNSDVIDLLVKMKKNWFKASLREL